LNFSLMLISAPAGFGKTTLLSQWIELSMGKKRDHRVAWVSLESDCDVSQFWRYITTALERLQLGIRQSSLTVPDTRRPPTNTISRVLLNEIAAIKDEVVLILDDYDRASDPAIHASLTFFINHLPSNMHLVIASRSYPPLPLARWRASNQFYELREDDLRFTDQEVATFFNELKGLDLSANQIAALGRRTEGWIAGLQLVALSLHDANSVSKRQFVHDFTGSQKYILDYLVEEVLHQQPDNIRAFLLQTAVLDHLNASLCNVVTGQNDSQAVLEYLERAQLFTIPLDHDRRWYRYHNLFLDVLRHRLQQRQPDRILELHRRAADWYAGAGQTDDAIRHACAAQEWQQAIELITPVISSTWNRGEISRVIAWLGKLPADYLDAHPQLSLYYSRALLLGGKMDAAEQRLQESEKVLRARPQTELKVEDRLLLGTVCAFRTTIAAVSGESASALVLGHEALNLLPPENIDIRAHVKNSLGVNYYYLGAMEEADRACTEADKLAQQAGNLYLAMVTASYRAKALVCQAQLAQAGQVLQQALDLGSTPGLPIQSWMPAASVVCSSFGDLLYEWNRLEEAEQYVIEAIELGQRLAFGSALWSAYHTLARIKLARGDQKGAGIEIEHVHRYRLTRTVPLPARLMDAEQARANLALGKLEGVKRWAASIQTIEPRSPGFIQEVEDITLARLHLFRNQPELALNMLDRLRPMAESSGRKGHAIEILALIALGQQALGQAQEALETLQTALQIAEPEGYLRTFVDAGQPMAPMLYQVLGAGRFPDYIARLLALFPTDEVKIPVSSPGTAFDRTRATEETLIEPLSQRELEVLQLMASGASNEEIAEKLVIATTTAKKHVSNILHKLGADNRTQAVGRGRRLGLCD
jgi:LuxR family maltose regulon positive regulatory protein